MILYVTTDEDGRICSTTDAEEYAGEGAQSVDFPEGFDFEAQCEWRVVDGQLVHEPPQPTELELAAARESERTRQVAAAVPMLLSAVAETMDDEELSSVALALPEWVAGVKRKRGGACQHGGVAYRVTANVSKNNDAEPGTEAGSGYYRAVSLTPDGVEEWSEPTDKHGYSKGDRVWHADRVWESRKNKNFEEPGTGDAWGEVSE